MTGYQITLAAEDDLRGIWRYNFDTWGPEQADTYQDQLKNCFDAIRNRRAPPRSLPQLPDEVCIHRCQSHYIFWLAIDRPIIIAVLHEKMDVVTRRKDSV